MILTKLGDQSTLNILLDIT